MVTKYTSTLKSGSIFYTDSNGKENLKRVRNFRPTWELNISEPVAGNYYPITSQISIRDESADLDLVVLVDRAQGGSSLKDGEIEVMVNIRQTMQISCLIESCSFIESVCTMMPLAWAKH